jgi:hypothetical protein
MSQCLRTLLLLACCALLAPGVPLRADDSTCSSSKAANDLVSCDHCHELKQLLAEIGGTSLRIEVYDLAHGALVQLVDAAATQKAAVASLTGEIWGLHSETGATTVRFCDVCALRSRKLQRVERDRVLTPGGAIVVLTGADDATIAWLREDARTQQRLLERAVASN